MKKVISLMMAVAMMSTMFVTSVFASDELPASIKVVSSTPVEIEDSVYQSMTTCAVPEGYSAYYVSVGLADVGGLTGTSTRNISGKQLSIFEYCVEFNDVANVYTGDAVYATDGAYIVKPGSNGKDQWYKDAQGNVTGYYFSSAEKYPGQVSVTKTDDDLAVLLELYLAVKDGTSVTATVNQAKCSFVIGNYSAGTPSAEKEYSTIENNLSFANPTFTIGAAAPTTPVISGNADTAKKAVAVSETSKGIVWNDVKIENVTKGSNWKIIFTDTSKAESDADRSKSFDLDFTGKTENEGHTSFAVILKTLKDAANITMSFDYTAN